MSSTPPPEAFVKEVEKAVAQHAFRKADKLYAKLMETHPMALSEILAVGKLIEKAKTANIDLIHLKRWKKLYDTLSEEERNIFFYSLKHVVVPEKKRILAHGTDSGNLFFIERGQVTVYITPNGKKRGLARLKTGDLLGEYSFTSISLCSASVITNSEVELRYIHSSVAEKWIDEYPGLYEKVVAFCEEQGIVEKILQQETLEKRSADRFKVRAKVAVSFAEEEGQEALSITGELSDVSVLGCCFDFHCSKREKAKVYLGRISSLEFETDHESIAATGQVVKITFHMHSEYSAHIRFETPLSDGQIKDIVSYN